MHRFALATVLFAGCANDSDLEAAFCDLLDNGPYASIGATASEEAAPEAFYDGQAVVIDLSAGRIVAFTPDERGAFAFGLSADLDLDIVDASGNAAPLLTETGGAACTSLATRSTWDLGLETYFLHFGGTATEVTLVAEESDDDL